MKKVVKKLNKALSVLLVAAMVVGVTPDVCLVANAEEPTTEATTEAESTESSESSAAVTSEEVAEPVETETAKTPETTADTPASQEENKESEATPAETTADEPADNTAGEEVVEDGAVLLNNEPVDDSATDAYTLKLSLSNVTAKYTTHDTTGEDAVSYPGESSGTEYSTDVSVSAKNDVYVYLKPATGYKLPDTIEGLNAVSGQTNVYKVTGTPTGEGSKILTVTVTGEEEEYAVTVVKTDDQLGTLTSVPTKAKYTEAFKFDVQKKDGYAIKSVKAYKTSAYGTADQEKGKITVNGDIPTTVEDTATELSIATNTISEPITIVIETAKEYTVTVEENTSLEVVYAVGAADATAEQVKGFSYNTISESTVVDASQALYVKVTETGSNAATVQSVKTEGKTASSQRTDASVAAEDGLVTYYKVAVADDITVEVKDVAQATYTITFDKDADSNYKSISYAVNSGDPNKLPANAKTEKVAKNASVTLTVETKDEDTAIKNFKVNGEAVDYIVNVPTNENGGTKYNATTVTYTFNLRKDTTISLEAAPTHKVTFKDEKGVAITNTKETIKYAGSAAGVASGVTAGDVSKTEFFYRAGEIYFTVAPSGTNVVKSVKVGDTVLTADKNGVYNTTISDDTVITVEENTTHTVTIANDGSAEVKYADSADATGDDWKAAEATISNIKKGSSVYLKVTAAEGNEVVKVTAGSDELTPVKTVPATTGATPTKAYAIYKVDVTGDVTVTIDQETTAATHKLTFDFTSGETAQVTYKVKGATGNGTTITKPAGSGDTVDVVYDETAAEAEEKVKIPAGTVYTFTVAGGSKDDTDYVVTKVEKDSTEIKPNADGVYTVSVTGSDITVKITTAVAKTVTFGYKTDADKANIDKILYSTKDGATAADLTNEVPADGKVVVANNATLKYKVVPKAGYKAVVKKGEDGQTPSDGIYTESNIASDVALTIETEGAYDVTFKTDVTGVTPTVNYTTVAKDATFAKPTALSAFGSTGNITDLAAGKDVYFVVTELSSAGYEIASIEGATKVDSFTVASTTYDYYKLADVKADTEVTVKVNKIYTITFDVQDSNAGNTTDADVKVYKVGDEDKTAVTSVTVKEGESYKFALDIAKESEEADARDKAKVKAVNWTHKNANGRRDVTDSIDLTENNQYEITPVAGTNTVVITADAFRDANLTFTSKDATGATDNTTVASVYVAADTTALATDNNANKATINSAKTMTKAEDTTVYAKITAADFYTIESVVIKGATEDKDIPCETTTVDSKTYYKIPVAGDLKNDPLALNIQINTKLDASKQSTLDFGANTADDESKEVKIAVTATKPASGTLTGYDKDGKWLTNAEEVTFTVDAMTGYEVTGLSINGEDQKLTYAQLDEINGITSGTPANKTFAIKALNKVKEGSETGEKEYANAAVVVTTKKKATTSDKTVNFTNNATDVATLAVKGIDEEFTKATTSFEIKKGATDFYFDVIVRGPYEPTVTAENSSKLEPESTTTVSASKTVYTYHLVAAQIDDSNDTFTITATETTKKLSLSYDKRYITEITVSDAKGNNVEESAVAQDGNTKKLTFDILKGQAATVNVHVPVGYELTTDGFTFVNSSETCNIYKLYITSLAEDGEYELTTAAITDFVLYRNDDTVEEPTYNTKAKAYNVTKDTEYAIKGSIGADSVEFVKGEFSGITVEEDAQPKVAEDKKSITFAVPAAAAGKTITVTATYKNGDAEETISYKLAVAKAVKKLTVKGVKNGEASQTMATSVSYGLSMSGASDYSILWAEVENPATGAVVTNAWIDASKKVLNIDTAAVEGKATVKIYAVGEVDKDGKNAAVAEFAVNSVKPDLSVKKVDLTAALHDGFIIKPTAGKLTTENYIDDCELAYIVEVTKPAASQYVVENPYLFVKTKKAASENVHVWLEIPSTLKELEAPSEYGFKTKLALIKWGAEEGKYTIVAASDAVESKFSTKDPYFEDKLTLTKGTTTIFSGQEDITVATPKFGKNTTFQEGWDCVVDVYDAAGKKITNSAGDNNVYAYYDNADNTIKVSVGKYVDKASYTIKVTPFADVANTQMYAAPASIKINVVNGIYAISTTPAEGVEANIYKAAGKAGTYKVGITYNYGFTADKPQKAAVTATIVDANKEAFATDSDIAKYVTYKNGKINVDKKYPVKADPKDNQFRVELKAADYAGNPTTAYTGVFTISDEKAELGKIYLAKKTGDIYNVVSKTTFTTDELNRLSVIVTKKDVADKSYYEEDDLVNAGNYQLTISNKKMSVAGGVVSANNQIAKNIKISAVTTDGSKNKAAELIITTEYNKDLVKGSVNPIFHDGFENGNYIGGNVGIVEKNGEYHYSAATFDNVIAFTVLVNDSMLNTDATYNYKVSVSGGKILGSNMYAGAYLILPTAQKTVVTLQDNTNKSNKTTYTFVNDAYVKTKAPNVTVEKKNLYADYSNTQSVNLYLAKSNYKYAYITIDEADYQSAQNNLKDNREFTYDSITGIGQKQISGLYSYNDAKGNYAGKYVTITIPTNAAAGNYKLNVVFGDVDTNTGAFVPATAKKTVSISVKKSVSFKPAKSYNLDPSVGYVVLSGTPAEQIGAAYTGATLQNANVNGQPNSFRDYFKLNGTKLVLKGKLDANGNETNDPYTAEELAEIVKADKNAFTGYISYIDFKTGNTEWAQIKVNVKAAKYTATDITAFAGESSASGYTYINKGWSGINVRYAYAESATDGIAFANIASEDIDGNKIKLTTTAAPEKGKYNVNLYVVDAASTAAAKLSAQAAVTNEDIKTYGTLVTLKFNVADPNAKNKLKIINTNINFDEYDYDTEALGWIKDSNTWYEGHGFYRQNGVVVDKITAAEGTPDYITIEQAKYIPAGSTTPVPADCMKITIDKAKLKAANEAAKKSILGTKVSVTVNVEFKNGLAAESYKLNITLPATIQTYAEALAAVEAGYEAKLAGLNLSSNNDAAIVRAIESLTHRESGLRATVAPVADSYQAPTSEEAGWYDVDITVRNADKGATDTPTTFKDVRIVLPAKNTTQTLDQAATAVNKALYDFAQGNTITNSIAKADILAIAQKAVTNPNIEVRYAIWGGWDFQAATEEAAGHLQVKILLSRSIADRRTCQFTSNGSYVNNGSNAQQVTIAQLDDLAAARTKVISALNNASNKNLYGVKTAEGVIAAAKAAINNPAIDVAFGTADDEKFALVAAATDGVAGSYTGTLYLTQEGKREQTIVAKAAAGDITGQLPARDNAAAIKTKIENAFTAYQAPATKYFTNSTTSADVLAIAQAANDNSDGYTITVKPDTTTPAFKGFDLTPATVKQSGKIKVTFVITKEETTTDVVVDNLLIKQLSQSITEAKTAANTAITDADWVKTLTNAATANTVKTQIETAVDTSIYTVAIGSDFKNTATTTAAGTITATVTISKAAGTTAADKVVFKISINVPAPTVG